MDPVQGRAVRRGVVAAVLTAGVLLAYDATRGEDGAPGAAPSSSASASPGCTAAWDVVRSANPDPSGNQLLAVTSVSSRDAWAVGAFGPQNAPTSTLVERWNGRRWMLVPSPNVGTENELAAVAATGPEDVWAVGHTSGGAEAQPLIEHWDGSAWTVSVAPPVAGGATLYGVASAGRRAWAVGASGNGGLGTQQALLLRWDGSVWSQEALPALHSSSVLRAVIVAGPGRLVAVGSVGAHPLALTFDGKGWERAATPPSGPLVSVTAVEGDGGWATGGAILRWKGSDWSTAGQVQPGDRLGGIAAISKDEAWAVGSSRGQQGRGRSAVIQRFDGDAWARASGPSLQGSAALTSVSAVRGGTVWAVGTRSPGAKRSTLVVRGSVACG